MSAQSSISPNTPITVKVTLGGDTRRFKIPLNDLGAAVFEDKLKGLLGIQDKNVVFERWSDSARSHVKLDPNNPAIYKQLFRAAKAKLKLRINARILEEEVPGKLLDIALEDELTDAIKALLVDPDTESINTTNIPPSYSTSQVDQIPSAPEPTAASQIISPKELDESVAKAVTTYCSSEIFTGQLRETVRDEVQKQNTETSTPDLISLQKSLDSLKITPKTEEETVPDLFHSPEFAVFCNACTSNIKGFYYHCSVCQDGDYDLCKTCIEKSIHCRDSKHWLSKRELIDGKVTVSDTDFVRKITDRICNGCADGIDKFVTCKTCKDYDLCLSCLRNEQHGHNPLHEFVRGTEDLVLNASHIRQLKPGRNAYHAAICDGCQKGIRGIRQKCLDCPDFDFCNECVASAPIEHPGHRFVPVTGSSKWAVPYYNNDPLTRVVHYGVYCDGPGCTSFSSGECIQGPRYKCAICPDTDFCANCEASPLNKHNATHPLIKMRTAIRNVLVTTDDGGEQKLGDPMVTVPASQLEPEKEVATTNAATQVHTIVDLQPTEEFATPPQKLIETEEVAMAEPEEVAMAEPEEVAMAEPEESVMAESKELEAQFVSDSIPDGADFHVGDTFTQTWDMKNSGTSTWPAGVTVKFVGGDYMFIKSEENKLDATTSRSQIQPGETTSFSVMLSATYPPNRPYISYWRLTAPDGSKFGDKLWCSINVKEARPSVPGSYSSMDPPFNDDLCSTKSVMDTDSVKDSQEEFESVQEDLERSNESHESQMIFPKLPVESPVHSIEQLPSSASSYKHELVPVSPVSSHRTLPLEDDDSIEGDICSIGDDDSFLTDEEYDVLDASDEEPFEECERVA